MEDGEVDFSNQGFSGSDLDIFLNEILKETPACTHTHTCNPPGPDSSHTHTCFHMHTKIVQPQSESEESTEKKNLKKRPSGNREAVRKYRQKKKAHAASLEDEVIKLRAVNQQLLKRLQGQATLEAEIVRLRCLLVDIRGRIEGEIGSFPYQKMGSVNLGGDNLVISPCNDIQCMSQKLCANDAENRRSLGENGQVYGGSCDSESLPCLSNQEGSIAGVLPIPGCGSGNVAAKNNSCSPCGRKKKGGSSSAGAGFEMMRLMESSCGQ
ncbi:hypothetical protein SAY86_022152 [Trapa natans]|uniref:BZIP domain-containing protein n=1 Tax=Trapa natans TaxID=22666 RepID=A0AAN7RG46_TRANT|nr:hypothetical protein SAY86_022152 [Trapa natans]